MAELMHKRGGLQNNTRPNITNPQPAPTSGPRTPDHERPRWGLWANAGPAVRLPAPVQRAPITWDAIEESDRGFEWGPHKTQPKNTGKNKALKRRKAEGYGAQIIGASGEEWKTKITFGATDSTTGDGTLMEANPLGPDHKIGEQPVKGVWNTRSRDLLKVAGRKTPGDYVAGHLLNHHLGGPGNDARNLAPIPSDANHEHEEQVERPIKELVNDELAWVYYRVKVEHKQDNKANVRYPSEFRCTWYQLDSDGEEIKSTRGDVVIDIKKPSEYGSASLAKQTKYSKSGRAIKHKKVAQSQLAYNQVLLDDTKTLGHRHPIIAPLMKTLQQMGMNDHFQTNGELKQHIALVLAKFRPKSAETDAMGKIRTISAEIEGAGKTLEDLKNLKPALGELNKALTNAQTAVRKRIQDTRTAVKQHLTLLYQGERAAKLVTAFETSINGDEETFNTMLKLSQGLITCANNAINEGDEQRKALMDASTKLREWLGADPIDPKASTVDLSNDFFKQVESGFDNVIDYFGAPGSPTQVINLAYDVTGFQAPNEKEARLNLAKHAKEVKRKRGVKRSYAEFDRTKSDERLLELLKEHHQSWPSWNNGENKVVQPIELLAKAYELGPVPQELVRLLYSAHTQDFNNYLNWLLAEPLGKKTKTD